MDIKEVLDKYGTPVNQKTKYNQYSTHSVIYKFKPDEVTVQELGLYMAGAKKQNRKNIGEDK